MSLVIKKCPHRDNDWSDEEIEKLQDIYTPYDNTIEEITSQLPGRTQNAIRLKASRLGLYRSLPYIPKELQETFPSLEYDKSTKLLSQNDTNSIYNKVNGIKLLLSFYNNFACLPDSWTDELLSFHEKIVRSKATSRTLIFLCRFKAATMATLMRSLPEIPEVTLYRTLKDLIRMGLVITPVRGGTSRHRKGGPRPRIYAILGYEPENIAKARERDALSQMPQGVSVERLTQLIMEEYVEPQKPTFVEIKWLRNYLKEKARDYYSNDLLELVVYRLQYVHNQKVLLS